MADVLNTDGPSGRPDWAVAVEVMQEVAKAALLLCLLWYAGQVVARQLSVPVRPASDVYWGFAEPRDLRSVSLMEAMT
jgi:hypothetical protein